MSDLLPAGDRSDYGANPTSVYEISGVGHGILADGADYLTPLTDTKGKAWSSATPIGVEVTSTGYNLITETVGKKGSTFTEYAVSLDGEVSRKGTKLKEDDLVGIEDTYNVDLNQDGNVGFLISDQEPIFVVPTDTEAAVVYVAGPIVDTDDYGPFDRSLDVYGLKLLAWPAVGGSEAVSDSFMEKTAHVITLMLDPEAEGINREIQEAMIVGLQDSLSWGPTVQRIGYVGGDNYSPSIVDDNSGKNYPGLERVYDTTRNIDMIWEYDESSEGYSMNGAITETIEHLLHTISQYGFPEVYPTELNSFSGSGLVWEAMQEAIANGVFSDQAYKPMDDGSNDYDSLLMREYVYLLTYAEWGYINEFVDGGSLAPEWADDARSARDLAIKNPLGHELFTDYISKLISKPSETVLKTIFSAEAPSGYNLNGSQGIDSEFSALIKPPQEPLEYLDYI